ncbi:MAG: class I SAM-dependent methyltransferase, partial [Candidatus Shikimatogenerans sp. JK-2022]|nr:class I SAM-dependent methyltransferase [Candidatus Shikimatogenerans bostrichidophilus]
MILNNKLYNYINKFINNKENYYLRKIRKNKYSNIKIMSNKIQGRFLSILSKIKNPKYILEIGTYLGYSTLCLAEGLKKKGLLISIEKKKKYIKLAKKIIKLTKYKKKIKIIKGMALKVLPLLKKKFDLVYIDADKINYIKYFKLVLNKVKKKGLIIVDNVLWKGLVLKKKKDKYTQILHNFNKKIKKYNINN